MVSDKYRKPFFQKSDIYMTGLSFPKQLNECTVFSTFMASSVCILDWFQVEWTDCRSFCPPFQMLSPSAPNTCCTIKFHPWVALTITTLLSQINLTKCKMHWKWLMSKQKHQIKLWAGPITHFHISKCWVLSFWNGNQTVVMWIAEINYCISQKYILIQHDLMKDIPL